MYTPFGRTSDVVSFKEPFKVAVSGDTLLYHHREGHEGIWITIQVVNLNEPARMKPFNVPRIYGSETRDSLVVSELGYFPVRFQVTQNHYYVLNAYEIGNPSLSGIAPVEVFRGYDLDGVVRHKLQDSLFHSEEEIQAGICKLHTTVAVEGRPGMQARWFGRHSKFRYHLYYDYLPDADDKGVRQFVLTDTRGRIIPPAEREKDGPTWEQTRFEQETPQWSFSVWHCPTAWDAKARRWTPGKWTKETELPVVFKEHFQVLANGEDWYLLTNSGKLYISPKPHGAPRVLKRIKLDGPIVGTIVDAQTSKHFLFMNTPEGQAFFELAPKPKLVVFDPKVAKVPEGDEPLRGRMYLARVLVALGKIKGK
jgi:hypothetical protein